MKIEIAKEKKGLQLKLTLINITIVLLNSVFVLCFYLMLDAMQTNLNYGFTIITLISSVLLIIKFSKNRHRLFIKEREFKKLNNQIQCEHISNKYFSKLLFVLDRIISLSPIPILLFFVLLLINDESQIVIYLSNYIIFFPLMFFFVVTTFVLLKEK